VKRGIVNNNVNHVECQETSTVSLEPKKEDLENVEKEFELVSLKNFKEEIFFNNRKQQLRMMREFLQFLICQIRKNYALRVQPKISKI